MYIEYCSCLLCFILQMVYRFYIFYYIIQVASYNINILSKVYPQIKAICPNKAPSCILSWNIPSLYDKRKNSFRVIFRVGYLESYKTFIIFVLSKPPTIMVSIHFVTHLLPNKRAIYDKNIIINLLQIQISLIGLFFFTLRCSTLKKAPISQRGSPFGILRMDSFRESDYQTTNVSKCS
ncbi:hypothetical protein EZS27_037076 [termite gut metagenome]|uniref:Uncharacterized protein n=1 Tax=termite gut metagenome TaxID=433724 RepID=A0A5J4PT50_9ZZZZ